MRLFWFSFLLITLISTSAFAQFRFTGNVTASRFEQQVKAEIGGEKGELLVEETQLGLHFAAAYQPIDYLSVGLYTRFDIGSRSAGDFDAFDANNAPITTNQTGGSFSEFWIGPVVSGHWKFLFAELGYGAFGIRSDDARGDLPGIGDSADSAFRTSPTVAWMVALGAGIPVLDNLDVSIRLEYRVRYYTARGSDELAGNVAHGTQNFNPFFGVIWTLD